jgi:hypothetical protein
MLLYLSMLVTTPTLYLAGPLLMGITVISLICSIVFEIKRISLYVKIKKKENKKLEKAKENA